MYYITKRGQALQYGKYAQHESIYGGDVKLSLHIGNTYQQILKPLLKYIFEISWSQQNELWYQWNQIVVDKINVGTTCKKKFKILIEDFDANWRWNMKYIFIPKNINWNQCISL